MTSEVIKIEKKSNEVSLLSILDKHFDLTITTNQLLDSIDVADIKAYLEKKKQSVIPIARFNEKRHVKQALTQMFETNPNISDVELANEIIEFLINSKF